MVLDRSRLKQTLTSLPDDTRGVLERVTGRIRSFAQAQRDSLKDVDIEVSGGRAGNRWIPVSSAGAYAPGGRYPLPSSVLMTVIPARVAGVESVWVASPRPTPVTAAAAAVAGADGLLALGGAQAIAALAFGTVSPACDLVVGPGNRWVTAAKKHLYGEIGIDGLAGPSEILVIADDAADPVLGFALAGDMAMAFAFTGKLSLGLDVGFYRTDVDEGYGIRGRYSNAGPTRLSTGVLSLRPLSNIDPQGEEEPEQKAGPLDARIGLKYAFLRGRKLQAAVLGSMSAPFGDEEMMLGDANLMFEPRLAVDYAVGAGGASKLLFNLGARIRQRTVLEAYDPDTEMPEDARAILDIGSEAFVGAGIIYELLPQLAVDLEAMYLQPLPEFFDYGKCRTFSGTKCFRLESDDYFADASRGDPAALVLGGISYRATPDVSLALGGGLGVIGARKEDFRLMSGVIWQPSPAGTRVIGRGDSDGDGLADAMDICADEPEDKDGFQDDDGCPDLDNDGDGIIDASDGCPDEPEDKDSYQDDDGCPEPDNDGDKVDDVLDNCPLDKEDPDGFEDQDGCPDEDNDGDGFPDDKDACPNERETVNGIDDGDGCPDSRTGGPQMEQTRIDLQGSKIAFAGARRDQLTGASRTLLDQVSDLIKDNRTVIIRIESHVALSTNSTAKRQLDQARRNDLDLTRRRARAVFDYLVGKGVARTQLREDPLGSTRPLRPPATDPINDRIELIRQ